MRDWEDLECMKVVKVNVNKLTRLSRECGIGKVSKSASFGSCESQNEIMRNEAKKKKIIS